MPGVFCYPFPHGERRITGVQSGLQGESSSPRKGEVGWGHSLQRSIYILQKSFFVMNKIIELANVVSTTRSTGTC
jgi:hypothetical protein